MEKMTRCYTCNKVLALSPTAWTCGKMFCSHKCGVDWAKTMYEESEYIDDQDLTNKATAYFNDIAEEINREDYGAKAELVGAYSEACDMTTIFEYVSEGDELISIECVGWYCGKEDAKSTQEYLHCLKATLVD